MEKDNRMVPKPNPVRRYKGDRGALNSVFGVETGRQNIHHNALTRQAYSGSSGGGGKSRRYKKKSSSVALDIGALTQEQQVFEEMMANGMQLTPEQAARQALLPKLIKSAAGKQAKAGTYDPSVAANRLHDMKAQGVQVAPEGQGILNSIKSMFGDTDPKTIEPLKPIG